MNDWLKTYVSWGLKFFNITTFAENRYVLGFIKYVMLNEDIHHIWGFLCKIKII